MKLQREHSGSAWRAVYLHAKDGRRLGCLGVDPNPGHRRGPELFVGLGQHRTPRFRLPHIPWAWVVRSNYSAPVKLLHRLSTRFWIRVDGRYQGRP